MISIEEFICRTNQATTQQEVFDIFCNTLIELGYDRVLYSLLTDHRSINKKAGHGIISNYPEDWMKHYMKNNYVAKDPVIKNAFYTSATYTWEHLVRTSNLNAVEKRVMDESNEAKLLDGAAVAIYGPNSEIAGVGLASSCGGIKPDKNTMATIRLLANQFHIAYSEFERVNTPKEFISLTAREREILSWGAEGKSNSCIAGILSVSDDAIKFHLKNIHKKLNVTDRTQAVVKAIYLGLINPNRINHSGNPNTRIPTHPSS